MYRIPNVEKMAMTIAERLSRARLCGSAAPRCCSGKLCFIQTLKTTTSATHETLAVENLRHEFSFVVDGVTGKWSYVTNQKSVHYRYFVHQVASTE